MELKNIIERLKVEIAFKKLNGRNLDNANAAFNQGIIISVNDLEKLINACEGTPSIEEIVLPISDFSVSLPSDDEIKLTNNGFGAMEAALNKLKGNEH